MKSAQRSHVAIFLSLIAIVFSVWFSRYSLLHARAEVLKPSIATSQDNLLDPTNATVDGGFAYDFTDGGDRSTYAAIYLNESGDSDVVFHDFDESHDQLTNYVLSVIFTFRKNKGDDGFLIEYSTEGSVGCEDAASRQWTTLALADREKGKVLARAEIENTNSEEVCVRISHAAVDEFDSSGYLFHDSNSLAIYDVWLDEPDAMVKMSTLTQSDFFAIDERFVYHLQVSNVGTGLAQGAVGHFVLPENVEYVSAKASTGWYNPVTGIWQIGDLEFGDSETLDVTVDLVGGRVGQNVQANTSVEYFDADQSQDESHATSSHIRISDVASGIPIPEEIILPWEPDVSSLISETIVATPEVVDVCADCSKFSFLLSIINPDGVIRKVPSGYARVTEIEPRLFAIAFEDKGDDMDYNDIEFELDVRDCENVRVTLTQLNAGWHHAVYADVVFDGVVQDTLHLWSDSHQGLGNTYAYNLKDFVPVCW